MIITKKSRIKFANSPKCIAYEYPMHDKNINIAYIEINGRYPEKDRVTNEKVKEIIFVVKGKGKIIVEKKIHQLNEGDSILVLPKQKYFFDGKLKIIAACSPAWYPRQHKIVE